MTFIYVVMLQNSTGTYDLATAWSTREAANRRAEMLRSEGRRCVVVQRILNHGENDA